MITKHAALNRQIAEALGYTMVIVEEDHPSDHYGPHGDKIYRGHYKAWRLKRPDGSLVDDWPYWVTIEYTRDGKTYNERTDEDDRYLESLWAKIPDWSNDLGAALALCWEIARERGFHLLFVNSPLIAGEDIHPVMFIRDYIPPLFADRHQITSDGMTMIKPVFNATGATPAEALSRLALAALQDGLRSYNA